MQRLEKIKELVNATIVLDKQHISDLVSIINENPRNDELLSFLETINEDNFSPAEAFLMADTIARGGKMLDLKNKIGPCSTRASIGDISDCVSLVVMSVLGSLGEKVVKLTSPAFGKFSNTITRMKIFDGFDASVSEEKFVDIVKEHGVAIYESTGDVAPVDDKLMYIMNKFLAPSIPLLSVSLLSKKIALGVSSVVYDVKVGEGGIVKDKAQGYKLAQYLVQASKLAGIKAACVVSSLNQPISASIGSVFELREVVKTLSSGDAYFGSDLIRVAREIVEVELILSKRANGRSDAGEMFDACVLSGMALAKFREIVEVYGGNFETILKSMSVVSGVASSYIEAETDGYLVDVDSIGLYSAHHILENVGGGEFDKNSGIVLLAREGEKVTLGQKIARITYSFSNPNFSRALKIAHDSLNLKTQNTKHEKLLIKVFV